MALDPDNFEYDMRPLKRPVTEEDMFSLWFYLGDEVMETPEEQARYDAWKAKNHP